CVPRPPEPPAGAAGRAGPYDGFRRSAGATALSPARRTPQTARRPRSGPLTTLGRDAGEHPLPNIREESMATHVDLDVQQIWRDYRAEPNNKELRNQLVEIYLHLVEYNANRIWQRLPDGVELDDLVSAGVFGLMD